MEKNVLIKWVNDMFHANIKKVEEMATGATYCQLVDALFPGKVPLHKVNFGAKFDYDFLKNFKILQDVFQQQSIQKSIDVNKLVKAKFQDNLEFLQWMKQFFDQKYDGKPYNAVERREQAIKQYNSAHGKSDDNKQKEAEKKKDNPNAPSGTGTKLRPPSVSGASERSTTPTRGKSQSGSPASLSPQSSTTSLGALNRAPSPTPPSPNISSKQLEKKHDSPAETQSSNDTVQTNTNNNTNTNNSNGNNNNNSNGENQVNNGMVTIGGIVYDMNQVFATITVLENQRDFYFGKLYRIEQFVKEDKHLDENSKNVILHILYQSEEETKVEAENETARQASASQDNGSNPSASASVSASASASAPASAPVPAPISAPASASASVPASASASASAANQPVSASPKLLNYSAVRTPPPLYTSGSNLFSTPSPTIGSLSFNFGLSSGLGTPKFDSSSLLNPLGTPLGGSPFTINRPPSFSYSLASMNTPMLPSMTMMGSGVGVFSKSPNMIPNNLAPPMTARQQPNPFKVSGTDLLEMDPRELLSSETSQGDLLSSGNSGDLLQ